MAKPVYYREFEFSDYNSWADVKVEKVNYRNNPHPHLVYLSAMTGSDYSPGSFVVLTPDQARDVAAALYEAAWEAEHADAKLKEKT